MKLRNYILFCFLGLHFALVSQNDQPSLKIWQLTGYSGQVRLRGNYRQSEYTTGDITSRQTDAYFNGIIQLRTKSFFGHPNLCDVKFNAIYNPQTKRDNYVGIPDYTETSNSAGLDFSATFLKKKAFNFATTYGLTNSIQNMDNVSRIKSKNRSWGVSANYGNKIVPLSAAYNNTKLQTQTIGSDRVFKLDQQLFTAGASRSFTSHDHSSLSYSHTENKSSQVDSSFNALQVFTVFNKIDNLDFLNDFTFDKARNYVLTSNVSQLYEHGTYDLNRFQVMENLNCVLPKRLNFNAGYNYSMTQQDNLKVNGQSMNASLSHQLYQSLTSRINYSHSDVNQFSAYRDQRNRFGFDLNYVKKIYKGTLHLNYSFTREYQKMITTAEDLTVLREEYILIDGQIVLLKRPNVNINSIVVKDITGGIIYQLWNGTTGDYNLIEHGLYIEIVRMPGGLIANNGAVYIDYTAAQGGISKYTLNLHNFGADVQLFKNILNIYYRYSNQDYFNITNNETNRLNYFSRHVAGVRFDINYLQAGVEYEYYTSTIVPFMGMKYFANFQKSYSDLSFSINANLTDYQMTNEDSRRQDIVLGTKVAYNIMRNLRADLDYMYRRMEMKGSSLDFHTSKIELTYAFRRLLATAGGTIYWNDNNNTKTSFKGLYIQLSRNF